MESASGPLLGSLKYARDALGLSTCESHPSPEQETLINSVPPQLTLPPASLLPELGASSPNGLLNLQNGSDH